MKNFTKMLLASGFAFFMGMSFSNAQFGCGTAVVIADGYTATGIVTPGTGGPEDWNVNPTGTSINASYWDDDVYLFEYTSGATVEQISMTIFTRNSWNGIGIFDDCTGTTFSTELDADGSSASSVSRTVTATIAAGNTVYIAVGQWGTPNDLDFDVTDFTVTAISCQDPSALMATNITATSADLGWTENGTATTWNIEWGVSGFTPTGTPNIAATASNPESLSGLTANTAYEFYVQSDCGGSGTSNYAGPFAFSTPCSVLTPAYVTDFATFMPSCWDRATDGTLITGPTGLGAGSWSQSGTAVRINLYTTSFSDWLISPEFDLSSGGWELVINAEANDYLASVFSGMGSDDSVQVAISEDNGVSWTEIYSFNASNQPTLSAADYIIDLSTYTGTSNIIGIRAADGPVDDGEDYYFTVNDFEIRQPLTCADPTMLAVSNIMASSADLTWVAGNGSQLGWGVSVVPAGNSPVAGTESLTAAYNATGLTDNTAYDAYVREICSVGDTTAWLGPISFSTPCLPFDGDNATTPLILTGTTASASGNTSSCFTDQSVGGGFAHDAPDAWYQYTLETCTDSLIVSLCGSAFDTYITIYASNGTTVIATNDDNFGECGSGGNSHLEMDINSTAGINGGDLIYIVVDGYNSGSGAYSLNVTQIESTVPMIDTQVACDSLVWNGVTYSTSGSYPWTGTDVNGCDSLVTLDLTINNSSTSTDVQIACDSLVWNGTTYMMSGTYTWTGTNAVGCDSTVTLDLTINNATTSTDVQVACDSLVWNGTTYTSTGMYMWTGTNAVGCDSVVTLDLTINNSSTSTDVQVACDSLVWNGTTYTSTGMYMWTGTNAVGCDSVVTLDLTINNSSTSTDVQVACDSLVWNGTTYTSTGMYMWTGTNAVGCDSVVTLDLTINNSSTSNELLTVCDSLVWNGTTYNTSGTYSWTGSGANGCDSTVVLDLTVNQSSTSTVTETACASYDWNGTTYTTSGMYMWTGTNAAGCDSIVTLDLTINTVDVSVTNNDPSIMANATGATYVWIDCDNGNTPIAGETAQMFTATANGNYAVIVTDANGCSDTSACTSIVTVSLDDLSPLNGVSVYPNPVSNVVNVDLAGLENAQVRLLDMSGKVLHTENCETTGLFSMEMNQAPGAYIIEVHSNQFVKQFKLIKE